MWLRERRQLGRWTRQTVQGLALAALSAALFFASVFADETEPRGYLPIIRGGIINARCGPLFPLPNGGFEDGPTIWQEEALPERPLIRDNFGSSDVTPFSGQWATWLGGTISASDSISQRVFVPACAERLTFAGLPQSTESDCGVDRLMVRIEEQLYVHDLCEANNTETWVGFWLAAGQFAGQEVSLSVSIVSDGANPSSFFLDDLAFSVELPAENSTPARAEVQGVTQVRLHLD